MCGQVLKGSDQQGEAHGGNIILITDGQENVQPFIDAVTPDILSNGVHVHSILYTKAAEAKVKDLTSMSGGKFYYDEGTANDASMLENLIAIVADIQLSEFIEQISGLSPRVQVK